VRVFKISFIGFSSLLCSYASKRCFTVATFLDPLSNTSVFEAYKRREVINLIKSMIEVYETQVDIETESYKSRYQLDQKIMFIMTKKTLFNKRKVRLIQSLKVILKQRDQIPQVYFFLIK
jgi:hypothetical protein